MKKIIASGALLLSLALPAAAEQSFSIELLAGSAQGEIDAKKYAWKFNSSDTAIGLRAAYNLNDYIGFELSFQDYGEMDDPYVDSFGDDVNDEFATSTINLGAKGSVPLVDNLFLQGRLGISSWSTTVEGTDSSMPSTIFKSKDSGISPYFGIGIRYAIAGRFIVGLERNFSKYKMELRDDYNADIEMKLAATLLTLGFKF